MPLISINPATGEKISEIPELTSEQIQTKLALGDDTFQKWRETDFAERAAKMKRLAEILRANAQKYGEIMTREMGKPITAARAEVEKCAWVCEYYAENAENFLSPEIAESDASESFVRFDPIGPVLAVMPWNFPFWQVLRFAAPTIMAGNVGLLKHASNVQGCAAAIEESFILAGFAQGIFQNLAIGSGAVETVIRDPRVKAITLTGSEYAGRKVAEIAGDEIKKVVLELGGSDPFIVLTDADVALARRAIIHGFLFAVPAVSGEGGGWVAEVASRSTRHNGTPSTSNSYVSGLKSRPAAESPSRRVLLPDTVLVYAFGCVWVPAPRGESALLTPVGVLALSYVWMWLSVAITAARNFALAYKSVPASPIMHARVSSMAPVAVVYRRKNLTSVMLLKMALQSTLNPPAT